MDQLEELVKRISNDKSTRAVVLTAEGDENFSVGMNLKQFAEGVERKGSADALLDQRLRGKKDLVLLGCDASGGGARCQVSAQCTAIT